MSVYLSVLLPTQVQGRVSCFHSQSYTLLCSLHRCSNSLFPTQSVPFWKPAALIAVILMAYLLRLKQLVDLWSSEYQDIPFPLSFMFPNVHVGNREDTRCIETWWDVLWTKNVYLSFTCLPSLNSTSTLKIAILYTYFRWRNFRLVHMFVDLCTAVFALCHLVLFWRPPQY